jgi:hypothetical protein
LQGGHPRAAQHAIHPFDPKVRVLNNLAQVWASYKARFGVLGKVDEWTGIDAFTLMKHDGHWKITGLTFAASEE